MGRGGGYGGEYGVNGGEGYGGGGGMMRMGGSGMGWSMV